jgi:acetyl-CoA acetyltransferase
MDLQPTDALIVGAVRTPIGRLGGALSAVRPDDLAAHALREALARAGVDGGDLEDVVLGCANQAGEDSRDVARMAVLLADLPEKVGGTTINRLCGSGLDAVAAASRMLRLGEGELYAAGGVESMSRAPWAVAKPARGFQTGPATMHDTGLVVERLGQAVLYATEDKGESTSAFLAKRQPTFQER